MAAITFEQSFPETPSATDESTTPSFTVDTTKVARVAQKVNTPANVTTTLVAALVAIDQVLMGIIRNAIAYSGVFAMNQTDEALQAFCQRARQIEDVIDVRISSVANKYSERGSVVRVVVRDLFGDAAWKITQLQSAIYRDFPDTRIAVDLEDLQTYDPEDDTLITGRS